MRNSANSTPLSTCVGSSRVRKKVPYPVLWGIENTFFKGAANISVQQYRRGVKAAMNGRLISPHWTMKDAWVAHWVNIVSWDFATNVKERREGQLGVVLKVKWHSRKVFCIKTPGYFVTRMDRLSHTYGRTWCPRSTIWCLCQPLCGDFRFRRLAQTQCPVSCGPPPIFRS